MKPRVCKFVGAFLFVRVTDTNEDFRVGWALHYRPGLLKDADCPAPGF
jgi:hypothetical protein